VSALNHRSISLMGEISFLLTEHWPKLWLSVAVQPWSDLEPRDGQIVHPAEHTVCCGVQRSTSRALRRNTGHVGVARAVVGTGGRRVGPVLCAEPGLAREVDDAAKCSRQILLE